MVVQTNISNVDIVLLTAIVDLSEELGSKQVNNSRKVIYSSIKILLRGCRGLMGVTRIRAHRVSWPMLREIQLQV